MEYAAKALAFITEQIEAGKTVYIQTATRTTKITPATYKKWIASGHPLFKATAEGLRMASGRKYNLITSATQALCRISAQ